MARTACAWGNRGRPTLHRPSPASPPRSGSRSITRNRGPENTIFVQLTALLRLTAIWVYPCPVTVTQRTAQSLTEFMDDPINFFGQSYTQMHSIDRDELESLQRQAQALRV